MHTFMLHPFSLIANPLVGLPASLRFADPWVLSALVLVPVVAVLFARRRPDRAGKGVVLSTVQPLTGIRPGWRVRLRPLLSVLRLAALALGIVALARPQQIEANATFAGEGIDIVMVLDISGSMREGGLDAANKIEAAKRALKKFLDTRKEDRIGFVAFKSQSRVMSPLSTDYTALKKQVDEAEKQNAFLDEGTAIGLGIADGVILLRDSHARSRVIVMATDGENNVTRMEPEVAGKIAESLGIRLYTIGIPTRGSSASATINEQQMRSIAEGTGGAYTRANNEEGLAETFNNIASLEKSRIERERFTRYNELAPWLLVPALALVLLETLLGATLFRRAP